jgi:hypothetical protein
MAVPARLVKGVVAHHEQGLDDDVLQYLVERRAQMNMPVGIWRPVMQDELLAARGLSMTWWYKRAFSQRSSSSGSFLVRLAFIGNAVCGRHKVSL